MVVFAFWVLGVRALSSVVGVISEIDSGGGDVGSSVTASLTTLLGMLVGTAVKDGVTGVDGGRVVSSSIWLWESSALLCTLWEVPCEISESSKESSEGGVMA